jgi:hypothetical protein
VLSAYQMTKWTDLTKQLNEAWERKVSTVAEIKRATEDVERIMAERQAIIDAAK